MQQPFGRDPQDLADVLDAIATEDDGRNMMPPQMTDFLSLFHVNNNDPRQTGGYVPNQDSTIHSPLALPHLPAATQKIKSLYTRRPISNRLAYCNNSNSAPSTAKRVNLMR
ncbi:hypothetical protein HOLleu_15024 [Holothuria leucospilota]|uniref:Uncharacterized protein n=1 Tax=Holothuria leucospilota TaxID=206669 RepID=A0A9Q1HCV0_HOLLE|nr:hypothetical protein HOLleu_15024 [Holothuria leucospilota]